MKVREVISRLEVEGWYRLKGKRTGHRQFKHPERLGKVTVPGKPGDDLKPRTLASIYKQASWEQKVWGSLDHSLTPTSY